MNQPYKDAKMSALPSPASTTVACDLCKATENRVLYTNADWKLPGLDAFALVQCTQCGLIYLNPRPTPQAIGAFYPQDYAPFRPAIEDEPRALMRWMRRRKVARLRKAVERHTGLTQGRILDVGCATGIFLHEMAQAGWDARGVELTTSAARYARERFGLEVYEGQLEEAPYAEGTFDAITFWDVLEHTFSPRRTLERSAALLRPGGIVAINIPNWESYERKLFGAQWIGYDPPRHLYVFPHTALETLLRESGFEILSWETPITPYFAFVISIERWLAVRSPQAGKVISRVLRIPGVRFLFEPYFAITNRRKRSGIISVFARKV